MDDTVDNSVDTQARLDITALGGLQATCRGTGFFTSHT